MKTKSCLVLAKEMLNWLDGEGTLEVIEELTGDKFHLLSKSLFDSLIVDSSGRLFDSIGREEAMLAFLMVLSMRYSILKEVSPSVCRK